MRAYLQGERVTLVLAYLPQQAGLSYLWFTSKFHRYHPDQLYQLCRRVSSCVTFFVTVRNNLEVLYGKHVKFTKKRENIITVDRK